MDIEVNTGEAEIDDVGVRTARQDEKEIVVDTTVEDVLDGVVEPMDAAPPPSPVSTPAPEPVRVPTPEPEPQKPVVVPKKHKKVPVFKEKKHHAPPPKTEEPPNMFADLDKNPQFARAMRSTLPKAELDDDDTSFSSLAEESEVEEEPRPKRKQPKPEKHPVYEEEEEDLQEEPQEEEEEEEKPRHKKRPLSPMSDGESSASSSIQGSQAEEEEEEDPKEEEEEEEKPQSREDEYIEKMKIIEEIKEYAKMGILPPQPPAFSMPISLLRKMRDYMMSKADEIMGIGLIGTGWISVIGIIEKLNGKYDPFAHIFETGLKLNGAKEAVASKIHLYEAVFKHIYAKMPKSKEMNPWIQFGLITMQILVDVHVSNMRAEMEKEAEETARAPETRENAEHIRQAFEEKERQRKAEREAQTTPTPPSKPKREVPPQPRMQPPSDDITDVEEDEGGAQPLLPAASETPKNEKIEMKQPPPEEETKLVTKDDETEEEVDEDEDDSDDDVVVQLPAPKRRGGNVNPDKNKPDKDKEKKKKDDEL